MLTIEATGIPSEEAFGSFVKVNFITRNVGQIAPTSFVSDQTQFNISISVVPGLASQGKFGTPNVARISDKPIISPLLDTIIPQHIVESYPRFLEFMQAFFEWTELKGGFGYEQKRLLDNQDIDCTDLDFFFGCFRKEFLVNIPQDILTDKAKLLKVIREYYQSRGSEKSFQMFFRFLLDKESDFFYPRTDMLRASDGKWVQKKSIRVIETAGNAFDLQGRIIRGTNNNASAFVENVQRIQVGPLTVFELFLNRQSIRGVFDSDEVIYDDEGQGVLAVVQPIVVDAVIINPGLGYTQGQEIDIVSNGSGYGARAVVKKVGNSGEVEVIEIKDFGAGYYDVPTLDFPITANTAEAELILGSLGSYPGFFLNNDGFLSDLKYLQDGNFYQQFSYVTIVDESIDVYEEDLKEGLHPAGWKHFGQVRSQNLVFGGSRVSDLQPCALITLCEAERAGNVPFGGSLAHGSDIILKELTEQSESTYRLGPTYDSLDRIHKFRYKPYEAFNAEVEVQGSSNSGYWDEYANAQVKDFGDFIIKDFIETPWKRTNIQPDPVVRTYTVGTVTSIGIPSGEQFGNSEVDV